MTAPDYSNSAAEATDPPPSESLPDWLAAQIADQAGIEAETVEGPAGQVIGETEATSPAPSATTPAKPVPRVVFSPDRQNSIPAELRDLRRWVLWKRELKEGRWTKVPYQTNGRRASSTDPSQWAPFPDVVACFTRSGFDGIGFVLTADCPYVGIDLDKCTDHAAGEIKPWAREFIEQINSYSEFSPSGSVKMIGKAAKPGSRCRKAYADGEVEMYNDKRFFTITAAHVPGTPTTVNDRQEAITAIYNKVFGSADAKKVKTQQPRPSLSLDDAAIIEKAKHAKNGSKFSRLWAGDTTEYSGDDSRADMALCCLLAFYTKEVFQLDRLIRASGLYREKWDSRRGETTYGLMTIDAALATVTESYTPQHRGQDHTSTPAAASDRTETNDLAHAPSPPAIQWHAPNRFPSLFSPGYARTSATARGSLSGPPANSCSVRKSANGCKTIRGAGRKTPRCGSKRKRRPRYWPSAAKPRRPAPSQRRYTAGPPSPRAAPASRP